mmetsp:Transcript_16922/g.36759  ORF Transcript_16922/g.36759 Transcript_16922/m.36759 type:complete len:298 (+) Transcript_16922:29-922(+)
MCASYVAEARFGSHAVAWAADLCIAVGLRSENGRVISWCARNPGQVQLSSPVASRRRSVLAEKRLMATTRSSRKRKESSAAQDLTQSKLEPGASSRKVQKKPQRGGNNKGHASSALSAGAKKAELESKRYFLFKSEGQTRMENGVDMKFSIDDLESSPDKTTHWDGVRNYQARNTMRTMKMGDLAFFYHSNVATPGIVGIVRVVKEAYADHTQFDATDAHYDPKSTVENPRWEMVDVQFVRRMRRLISLRELQQNAESNRSGAIAGMQLVKKGQRLSVQQVDSDAWNEVMELETSQE